jgi:hypothetical protein
VNFIGQTETARGAPIIASKVCGARLMQGSQSSAKRGFTTRYRTMTTYINPLQCKPVGLIGYAKHLWHSNMPCGTEPGEACGFCREKMRWWICVSLDEYRTPVFKLRAVGLCKVTSSYRSQGGER